MARIHEEDIEPLDLYFTDRSLLYEGWDDSDMYDFSSSLSKLALQRWKKQNDTSVNLYYFFSLHNFSSTCSTILLPFKCMCITCTCCHGNKIMRQITITSNALKKNLFSRSQLEGWGTGECMGESFQYFDFFW